MATKKCCSGCSACSGGSGCYGALNCVAGPYACRNYPYYTGPCAPAGCRPPWDYEDCRPTPPAPPPMPVGNAPVYGFFNATSPVSVAAGGIVPLSTTLAAAADFSNTGGNILLRRPGVYLLSYRVQLGTEEAQATRYSLALNGATLSESVLDVTAVDTSGESKTYSAQVIVQAPANSTLTLTSSAAVTASAVNPYSLSVVRLG